MASSSHFKLTSTATAVALVVPGHLQPDINSLRKLHDKAYRKWEPHINLLYPFVDPSQLPAAVSILRQHLLDHQHERLRIDLSQVDTFTHRRNATVFLKPSPDSEMSICQLRASMATSLGCDESEGTHDGTFRPHMTMGQASLAGLQLNRLSEKVEKLTGLAWQGGSVVVLKREPWGEMRAVEELPFGIDNDEKTNEDLSAWDGYKNCFSFAAASGWSQDMTNTMTLLDPRSRQVEMTVATYNLMADESAPSFVSRLPLIMDAIKSATESSYASLQVLCLQEVNDEMLPLLLAESYIQETYPYSSHSPSSLLLSHRNLVTLSSRPFKFAKVDFSEHHKCMLDIYLVDTPVRVVNVHLSSALTDESTTAKRRQMDMVTEFTSLSKDSSQRDVIVTGDFNLTSSSSTIQTALSRRIISPATAELVRKVIDSDIWNDAFVVYNKCDMIDEEVSEGEQGATFDRSTNPLAATSEPPIDRRPQRYDRVLFRKGGDVHVQQLERFGFPNDSGHCGSDHYGVCATLRIGNSKSDMYPPSIEPQNSDLEIVRDTRDVRPLVEPYLPRSADQQLREDALETLHRTLSKNSGLQDLILAPLGSYLMDTYFADSDVDVLAIGAVPSKVFFDYASAQLQELAAYDNDANEFKGVHLVNSLVSIIELSVRGIKFDLQYCQAPELIERYHQAKPAPHLITFVFDTALISRLSPSSLRPLNTYRDTAFLLNTISDLPSYRLAHRFLSLYLKRRGLYSAKFGYLGGIHLSLMLNRVVKLILRHDGANTTPATIIRTFFDYYASFNWAKDIITDPELDTKPSRLAREAIFIHAIHVPTARPNVASSCTRLSAQTLTSELRIASRHLEDGDWQWCLRPRSDVIAEFLNNFGAFVRISIDVWDIDEIGGEKVREIVGGLESKITRLLVGLGRLSGIDGRVWPARFHAPTESASSSNPDEVDEENQLKGYYLVGISAQEDDAEKQKILTSRIIGTVREFETSVKEAREFQGENTNVWLSMDLVPKKKLLEMGLVIDERDWGGSSRKVPRSLLPLTDSAELQTSTLTPPSQTSTHRRSSSRSLRPAQDIISRIKWDGSLNIEDFLIGYEDRFVGVKEVELGRWKSEQTDEEFIPMHRIVWVRRKDAEGEGEKVWDRRAKIDAIFGSGIGTGLG